VWATENRPVFGQVKTEEKSKGNEVSTITAIPTLLEKVALEGCIVTIDAMGSQYNIARPGGGKEGGLPVFVKREPGNAPIGRERILCGPGFLRPLRCEPAYIVSVGTGP
jgi:hypothetical protein